MRIGTVKLANGRAIRVIILAGLLSNSLQMRHINGVDDAQQIQQAGDTGVDLADFVGTTVHRVGHDGTLLLGGPRPAEARRSPR